MAIIRPFKGFRPLPEYVVDVVAKPYDVLTSEEACIEAEGKPLSFLHVTKPEIDLPVGTPLYDQTVYQKGKENLQKLISGGILKQEPMDCFYLYAQTMGTRTQYGVIGCVSVQDYLNNAIKKHELTRQDKEEDRTQHVRCTNAHTGPIFLIYKAEPEIEEIMERIHSNDSLYDFITSDDGIRHQLWLISDDELIRQIIRFFSRVPYLYVADGHHRSAAAARIGKERAVANPFHDGSEEYNYFLAVLFPHNQIQIMEYNRLVKDLNGLNEETFLESIKKMFVFNISDEFQPPKKKGEFSMYLRGSWYILNVKTKYLNHSDIVERLDVSILQKYLLEPILDINDPRTSKRIDFVGGIREIQELEKRVDSGEMKVAFVLYPISVDELLAVADAGKIMPPKSTWFEPKLRDGIVVHFLN
nr:DUF1015 domain-containing protein [Nitrosomonas nitrosa]